MNDDYIKTKRLLLVDDELELLNMEKSILTDDGYKNIETAVSVTEALSKFASYEPELLILDVMLPDGDGFSFMKQIRKKSDIPVLFLTARGESEDRFRGLGIGADDYIVKPFLPKELTLRLSAILRRCYKAESNIAYLVGSIIDFEKAEVQKKGEEIPLTAKEYALLFALYQNANRILTIDALCTAAWGDNYFGYENSLMAHIRRIREKIENDPSHPVSLITTRGLGYKLIIEDGGK
ncbi:response regulator transcription factor [Clostridium sp. FP2]|uniref:response regulator transcription factor n=1 Tax=Clostridium sp. FP2 TaxID=2724481 RepID=UPI0013E8F5E4|nr:response regulator transcription factor [Clostridium sp. FP2]MBZ9623155.1 response regulator transcription factor [Clostridium sp. FP2]